MKKKIILAGKIIIGIFLFFLGIVIVITIVSKKENIVLPSYIGIPFFLSLLLTVLTIFIMFVCEMVQTWKEKKIRAIWEFVRDSVIMFGTIVVCDTFIMKNEIQIIYDIVMAIGIGILMKTFSYWKRTADFKGWK